MPTSLRASANYVQESGRSTLPDYLVPDRQNLGYSAASHAEHSHLELGRHHSKVKQAALREKQSELDLGLAESNWMPACLPLIGKRRARFHKWHRCGNRLIWPPRVYG